MVSGGRKAPKSVSVSHLGSRTARHDSLDNIAQVAVSLRVRKEQEKSAGVSEVHDKSLAGRWLAVAVRPYLGEERDNGLGAAGEHLGCGRQYRSATRRKLVHEREKQDKRSNVNPEANGKPESERQRDVWKKPPGEEGRSPR